MSKYVYLYELDSVRKTDAEILAGQKAMYDEIVGKGNVVVLTLNQLVDSRGFFSLLDLDNDFRKKKKAEKTSDNPNAKKKTPKKNARTYYDCLIHLFEKGWIRVSMYGKHRSLAGYVIDALSPDKTFVFSGWPLKSTQKKLIDLMLDAVLCSDLTEVYSYIKTRDDNKILELFSEDTEKSGDDQRTDRNSEQKYDRKRISEYRNILENIYWFLKLVLRLSVMHQIYITPRDRTEFEGLGMGDLMKILPSFHPDSLKYPHWNNALEILQDAGERCRSDALKENKDPGRITRSDYTLQLRKMSEQDSWIKDRLNDYMFAEAILNLCYNYSLEISIRNVSKHYNFEELKRKNGEYPTFEQDFLMNLEKDWNMEKREERYLQPETDSFSEYTPGKEFPNYLQAVRLLEYGEKEDGYAYEVVRVDEEEYKKEGVPRYEDDQLNYLKNHHGSLMSGIIRKFIFALFSVALVCGLELFMQLVQQDMDEKNITTSVVSTILILFVTEFITALLTRLSDRFLQLSDAIAGIFHYCYDLWKNGSNYRRAKKNFRVSDKDSDYGKEVFSEPIRK